MEIYLISSKFNFYEEIYEQTEGVAMGSPHLLLVANLFMEYFEKKKIDSFPLKPKWWLKYVDDVDL